MVDSRSLGYDIDNAIETGLDNQAVRADVEGWCKHLNVELIGVSPLGQAVGVPIGPHGLSCEYAQYATESIALRSLFEGFLNHNCAGCAHHQPGPHAEFGQQILASIQQRDAEARAAETERQKQIESLRQELVELADQRAAAAQQEAASVFRLTVDLFAETESNATQMLCETSKVAPELFEERVIDLLELGASDEIFAAKCLPVLANLAQTQPTVRDRIRRCVIEASKLNLPIEVIAESITACLSDEANEITDTLVDRLIAAQDYERPIGGWVDDEEPKYSSTVGLLVKLIDRVPDRVLAVVDKRLKVDQKRCRANTSRVVKELSRFRPQFGLRTLPQLIRSLELDDDVYGISADGSAVDTVSELLVLNWAQTDVILQRESAGLSADARTVLVDAYEKVFRRGDNWRDETTEELDEHIISSTVKRCLELLNDTAQEPSIRRAAAEAIHTACRAGAEPALNAFDQLFGCLAIVTESEPPAVTPTIILPGHEEVQAQEEMLKRQNRGFEWTRLKGELAEIIEEIGERRPIDVGNALIATIDAATSANRQSLRRAAIRLLGKIASRESELPTVALPTLMTCLMDYSSPAVRAVAVDATRDAFRQSHLTVPSNVVDVIVLHLRDQYVVVHKSAVSAFRFWRIPLTELQRREAFTALFYIWKAYAKNPNEKLFMEDIADALLSVGADDIELRQLTLRLICEYLPTGEVLVDSKLCKQLIRHADAEADFSGRVAKALIECLARHARDRYRHGRDWRGDTADWLSVLSRQVWRQLSADFTACAEQALERDPGEALLFASVLCEHGDHLSEAHVLKKAAESAAGHSIFHGLADPLLRLSEQAIAAQREVT